jgi:error-prone DNA polymerase
MAASTYAELHCKTNFSFLLGASHPEELVERAAQLGYRALAITDRNSLAGVVRAHAAAKPLGLKLLIGAEITPVDAPPVLLYAPDLAAYRRLARLISQGRRAAAKGDCRLSFATVADHAEGLLAAVLTEEDLDGVRRYRAIFSGRCYLAVALHRGPNDERRLERQRSLARRARLPLVACNDVHYHDPTRRPLHEVLTATRHHTTVAALAQLRFPNGERHLKAPAEMHALFAGCPRALANGLELADRCTFSLDELRYDYPLELCPPGLVYVSRSHDRTHAPPSVAPRSRETQAETEGLTPMTYLEQLTWAGARERYPRGVPEKVQRLLRQELRLIAELRYEAYFLTVWDIVQFARQRDILCQGRGSAANSAVCYCLGVTAVDPERIDVLFERFVSRERNEPPDIDVDFEHERREEVLQYIYAKYGRDRAALVAEVITYRSRSAVRDVGKALGLSLDRVDRLSKVLDPYHEPELAERLREAGLDPASGQAKLLVRLARELLGFPRHLSQHVGGMVISRGPLCELVPIENAAMPDRTVIEWDKDDLDTLGILKIDCLGLGMLTALRKCMALVERHHGASWTLATLPAEDPVVYEQIGRGDTVGVFQIESRAQMVMLPRLVPRSFYDLVIEVAIVRPGPIQGGMVHPYLRRRAGTEPVTYPNRAVEAVLKKTLGVPLFQEQVMRLAMVAAGFSAGEADQLRRAMGAWRRPGLLEQFRAKLLQGMLANDIPAEFAERLFEQIKGFGEYGFPESHAASFALLAYASAWLRCYYPAAFAAALLNSQPMGFYAPAQLVRDARVHGVTVLPPDVNHSAWDCTLEGTGTVTLRLGFRLARGLPEAAVRTLTAARADRPFRSIAELARRTQLSRPLLARLAAADALASIGWSRRQALWQVLALGEQLPLFAGLEEPEDVPPLEQVGRADEVVADYDAIGLSLRAHPLEVVRPELDVRQVMTAEVVNQSADQALVQVAGLVLVRQRPSTAKGTVFVTLEDETGMANLVIWPQVWQRYRRTAVEAVALLAAGTVQRSASVVHVVVRSLENLASYLQEIAIRSRDFH